MHAKYKRVVLKISGEALAGEKSFGLDTKMLKKVASEVAKIVKNYGVEVSIVIGGGNFWRGAGKEMDRTRADHMGMLATMINSLALQDAIEKEKIQTRVMSAIDMQKITESYIRNKAIRHLKKGRVVIFACGTGNPFFSTDTAAALRAAEIEADLILLAKNVDGVYDADPKKDSNAKRYDAICYMDILNKGLGVMDSTATSLCMDNKIPILVFGLDEEDGIEKAVCGEKIGTIVE